MATSVVNCATQYRKLLKASANSYRSFTTGSLKRVSRGWVAVGGVVAVGGLAAGYSLNHAVNGKAHDFIEPPAHPWSHGGWFESYDHASIRRGFQVYKQVCASCHTMEYMNYRHLVGVSHTTEEVKAIAAEASIVDGPDEEGNMFERPGKLSDFFQKPYKNKEHAMYSNNGLEPPDLTRITLGREYKEDYIFALLTGYLEEPPAGVTLGEGQAYNIYFPGQVIGMPQQLYPGVMEYEDGTPATVSQLAKDVCTFMCWTADDKHDTRKRVAMKGLVIFSFMIVASWYWKRHNWASLKTAKLIYHKPGK